jgi:TRAP-type C4-dicarboxylate transport system permease small subunit
MTQQQGKASGVERLFTGIENLMAALLVVMVALVFGNVVLRYAFSTGIIVSEELSRFALVWLVFLGAVVAAREGAHLGSDALLARLSPRWLRLCAAASQLLVLGCCGLLGYGLWQQHGLYAGARSPVAGLPMIWIYGVGYATAALVGALSAWRFARIIGGRATPQEMGVLDGEGAP